ncbi:MAG: prolyl oligopeptidase family serine peptidase, partial [Candidatus Eremiobacteraeota bacterium]|nr:prolyl oligopeptidase family serine peptidase [Candidatus Eremiobacteraeota bacterium]
MNIRQLLVPLAALSLALVACSSHGGSSLPVATAPQDVPASTESAGTTIKLGSYHIDPNKVFVAGISAGGFFAVQMHVAHSAVFKGAAIYAGGVYFCAQDSVAIALAACGGEGLYAPELTQSEAYLDAQSQLGTIDPESNLADHPVYLWSGTADTLVNPKSMFDLDSEYGHYRASPIVFDSTYPAEHGWESPDGSLACGTLGEPYMIKCYNGSQAYDSEKTWLGMFLGTLRPRNEGKLKGTLQRFDQTEFGASASNSMDTTGWVYVPKPCASGKTCAFILALHGCTQGQAQIGNTYATESGINEWADTNDV